AAKLVESFAGPLKITQVVLTLVEGLDLQMLLRSADPGVLAGALLLGLETSSMYCVLASSFGIPINLVIEEVTSCILKYLKEVVRQVISPLQCSEAERNKKGPSDGG
ncbi:CYN, partial [Symbiodinium pilosum]